MSDMKQAQHNSECTNYKSVCLRVDRTLEVNHDRDYLVRGSEQHLPPRCPRADTCREKTAPCPRNLSTVSIIGRGIASPTVVLGRLDEVHLPVLEPHSLKYGVWKSKLQGLGGGLHGEKCLAFPSGPCIKFYSVLLKDRGANNQRIDKDERKCELFNFEHDHLSQRAPEPTNIPEGRNLCDKRLNRPFSTGSHLLLPLSLIPVPKLIMPGQCLILWPSNDRTL
ncbi:hypothetical protein CDAR_533721 [Caerostris darwini]|uniref:Uncharacterized protein n=1 Tax=Caerostris darwini TaxID=1538125 RepID=A0AAV4S8I2_9ARAC|nr:hypothetical protein CDAR_533721 [Caerostris darwini]